MRDLTEHRRILQSFLPAEEDHLLDYSIERMKAGAKKHERPGIVYIERDLVAEAIEELVDGLNRLVMRYIDLKQGTTAVGRPQTEDRRPVPGPPSPVIFERSSVVGPPSSVASQGNLYAAVQFIRRAIALLRRGQNEQ